MHISLPSNGYVKNTKSLRIALPMLRLVSGRRNADAYPFQQHQKIWLLLKARNPKVVYVRNAKAVKATLETNNIYHRLLILLQR